MVNQYATELELGSMISLGAYQIKALADDCK